MSIKSDKWIRRTAQATGMIEPFEPGQVREVDGRPVGEQGRPVTAAVERAFADYVAARSWVEPSTRTQVPAGR